MRQPTRDRSWSTHDRGPPDERATIYTVETIGPRRELMKNGNLVCYDVPIARVGWMMYGPGEVPVTPNPTQMALYVERTADDLFDPDTIASFYGVAVVNDHPPLRQYPEGVTPDNFKELAGGYAVNPRPGKDGNEDVLLADLIITRRDLIEAIRAGKKEVSAGYDASYETVRPGIGRQRNIIANHIALVDKGRCGPRCAIGDHATQQQEKPMAGKEGTRRRIDPGALDAMDEFVQEQRRRLTTDASEEEGIHVHVHTGSAPTRDRKDGDGEEDYGERMGKIEKMVGDLSGVVTTLGESMKAFMSGGKTKDEEKDPKKDEEKLDDNGKGSTATDDKKKTKDEEKDDKDGKGKTEDSAALATSWQELASKCEILVPGFQMPTFDAALPRASTVDSMCGVRKKALADFMKDEAGAGIVKAIVGDSALDAMGCDSLAVVFNAASAAKATANNARATQDAKHVPGNAVKPLGGDMPANLSAINAANKKFWQKNSAAVS